MRPGVSGNKVAVGLVADLSELSRSIALDTLFPLSLASGSDDSSHVKTRIRSSYALDDVEIDDHARGKSKYLVPQVAEIRTL